MIDHVRALKHGGADAPSNMQWQTTAAAKAKDKVKKKLLVLSGVKQGRWAQARCLLKMARDKWWAPIFSTLVTEWS